MVNSQDMLEHLKFSKLEQEVFKEISNTLDEQYEQAVLSLEEFDEVEEEFGEDSLGYCNALDRAEVITDTINNVLSMHPSILMDPQSFRLAQLAAGFIGALQRHMVNNATQENNDDSSS